MNARKNRPDVIVFFDFTGVVAEPSRWAAKVAGLTTAAGGLRLEKALLLGDETKRIFARVANKVRSLPIGTALQDVPGATDFFDPKRTENAFTRSLGFVPVTPSARVVEAIRTLRQTPGVEPVMMSDLPAGVLETWMRRVGLPLDIMRTAGDAIDSALSLESKRDGKRREAKVAGVDWFLSHPATGEPPQHCMLVENRREAGEAFLDDFAGRAMNLTAVIIDPGAKTVTHEDHRGGRLVVTPPSQARKAIEGSVARSRGLVARL